MTDLTIPARTVFRGPPLWTAAAVALLLLAGCKDGPTETDPPTPQPAVPASVELDRDRVVLADGSETDVGATVRDAEGAVLDPLPAGHTVTWHSDDEAVARIVADGRIRGVAPGETRVRARVGELEAVATVVVTQVPAEAALAGGQGQEAGAGQAFGEPIAVRVADRHGEGVEGVVVRFEALSGTVEPVEAATDVDGRASALWTPDPRVGTATLIVRVGAVGAELEMTGVVRAGAPATAVVIEGGSQTGTVGEALPAEVRVRVEDAYTNPVVGAEVRWSTALGGGSVTETSAADSAGVAAARWTLGTLAGEQRLEAEVGELDALVIAAIANPGAAARVRAIHGAGQEGVAGAPLADSLVIAAYDRYENPVPGAAVAWSAEESGSIVGRASTDASGRAGAVWTLGPAAGAHAAAAAVGELEAARFEAKARADVAAAAEAVSGEDQEGEVGTPLGEPLIVRIVDRFGNPVPDVEVFWASGAGTLADLDARTDAKGIAHASWTLGPKAATQTAAARTAELVRTFEALARPGAITELAVIGGSGQEAEAGVLLPDALVVRASDRYGNPVPGAALTWSAEAGSFLEAGPVTDAVGEARARWTLGTTAGDQAARAEAGGQTASFHASARARPVAALALVSGSGQEAEVGRALPDPLVVRATDAHGNPVPDAEVRWTAGAGTLSGAEVRTDADGLARASWTLGTAAGDQGATAEAGGVERAFEAVARPGAVAELAVVGGSGQEGEVGTRLASDLVVRATDRHGNRVPGAVLTWTAGAGSLADAGASTDEAGEARARWTLGTVAGSQIASASASGKSAAFAATARPGAVAELHPSPASVRLEERWQERSLAAEAVDRYGNIVPGATLSWTSDNDAVATVSAAGLLRAERKGATTARVTAGSIEGRVEVEVAIPTIESTVGTGGGEVTTDDGGAALDFPPAALAGDVTLSVAPTSTETLPQPERMVAGTVYTFEPSGTRFEEPVQVRIRYDPAKIPAGVQERHLRLHRLTDGVWRPVDGGSVDLETRTVSASLTSFSVYGIQADSRLEEDAMIALHLDAAVPFAHVTRLRAVVTGPGIGEDIHAQLTLKDGRARATIDVPPGTDRTVTVLAYDAAGIRTHAGSAKEDFPAGADASITVTLDGLEGDQPIEVRVGTRLLRVDPASATRRVGQTIRLDAYLEGQTGEVTNPAGLVWGSSNPALATVASDGTVTARHPGTVRIVANYEGVAAEAVLTITD